MAPSAALSPVRTRGRRPDQLVGGRHGLSADEVVASQRTRILSAITAAVGENGYHGVRVADVVWRAGVSRKTFYELFGGKEECFTAAYEQSLDRLLGTTFAAFDAQVAWLDRLRAGITALLGELARHPDAARMCFVEAATVGGAAAEQRELGLVRLEPLFDVGDGPGGQLGATLRSGRVSELCETVRREIVGGRAAQLPSIVPTLMCALVLPFLGMEAAQRELERGAGALA